MLKNHSLRPSQSFSFLDKSTGPYLPFVALALSKICQCIFIMSLLSPLGKGHDPSFERPCRHPSPKAALCQVCLKLVLKKMMWNFFKSLQQLRQQTIFCQRSFGWAWIGPGEKKMMISSPTRQSYKILISDQDQRLCRQKLRLSTSRVQEVSEHFILWQYLQILFFKCYHQRQIINQSHKSISYILWL